MARLGAAVNVVTTDGPAGRYGFTASAVCSVSDEPPMLLVCVNRNSDSCRPAKQNGVLCVNVLTHAQQALSPVFGGLTDVPQHRRFSYGSWTRIVTGAPALIGAAVSFDCRVVQVVPAGTHDVLFCEVDDLRTGADHEGLIYFGRSYHRVAQGG
ncbi:MAG: flavin reductase [Acetobacteraceae bacterium]|nr:flavin reductase [Acetobacteraceae bacterium]